jgi:hypothetical protein
MQELNLIEVETVSGGFLLELLLLAGIYFWAVDNGVSPG